MSKCTEQETLYEDIEFCQGKKSLPGSRDFIYGISKRDIVAWPTIDRTTKTTLGTVAVYDGNFTLATDKKWHKLAMIPSQGQLQIESQGTFGSKSFAVTCNAYLPGTEEEVTSYIAEANNDEMVYLFVQRNGKARVIGSEAFTPELTLGQDSGQAATDTNQTTLQIVATDEYPAPFYPGVIATTDGDISGETGKPIVESSGDATA